VERDGLGGREPGEPSRSFTDVLRSEIVSGVFSPNERLVEADLSDLYRVSRGTARAALTELAKEGLVERQPNRGARVRALSPEEATELTEARFAMEGLCAGHAARHATGTEVAELHALLSAMGESAEAQDVIGYYDLVAQLGQRIRAFSRHRSAAALAERLLNQLAPYSTVDSYAPGRINASLKEFDAIVDAIAGGDPEAAEAAMRDHRVAITAARREVANRGASWRSLPQSLASTTGNLSSSSSPSGA
jgi:DNA-binding GntR family transcriptional regulator